MTTSAANARSQGWIQPGAETSPTYFCLLLQSNNNCGGSLRHPKIVPDHEPTIFFVVVCLELIETRNTITCSQMCVPGSRTNVQRQNPKAKKQQQIHCTTVNEYKPKAYDVITKPTNAEFLRRDSSKVRVVYMWSRSLRIHTEQFSCRSKYKRNSTLHSNINL